MRDMRNAAAGTRATGRNDPCPCGSGKKYKACHLLLDQESRARRVSRDLPAHPGMGDPRLHRRDGTLIKTAVQIEGIRQACQLTCRILDMLQPRIVPGITTEQINQWVHDATLAAGAIPAPLNYPGPVRPFPKSVCTSINEVVCHGIPDGTMLHEGDIINVDVTSVLNGYFGDASRMYLLGEVSPQARKLVEVTRECLALGIDQVRPGGTVGDIGQAIQAHAESNGFSVVRDFVGHGVGLRFHEEPQIPHFGQRGRGPQLQPGMVFTIEPMINAGDWRVRILPDGWTAVTRDRSLSAQFEHTVEVTSTGVQVLSA